MKKKLLYSLLLGMFAFQSVSAADYGLPANIQEGNILHCFNWPAKDVKAALPQIAAAGFGAVQLSPLQRGDVKVGSPWHDLYRPYDLGFKPSSFCSEQDLKDLCSEAATYGIKIIVDVVANHVDKTAGYHDTWWDGSGRVRWEGGIDYGNRYSITHGQLGDYGDINSENSDVINRGKAYVEKLKSLGVKGCRWDAAKHIGLPSEGCNFWSTVASVSGMWHYGEILDNPGPDPDIIKEYTKYMSVTDNKYCNYAAQSNGGIPGGYGGAWAANYGLGNKCVYWAESHDTYSNDEWSMNVDQSVIDRAYAAYACRNDATALYLSRPNTKGFNNIKVGKGSTAFTATHIAEVNKFRNAMVGRKDYFDNSNGNACSITREGGGAVIVMKGSGNVTVKNGGGYCPAGTYKDRVSGGTFTVTASTISGNVGSSGIAVLIKEGLEPPIGGGGGGGGGDDPINPPVDGDMWILGNLEGTAGWSTTPGTGAAMTLTDGKYVAKSVKMVKTEGETVCYFNLTDYVGATWNDLNMSANRYGAAEEGDPITLGTPATVVKYANDVDASGCLSWTIAEGTYDFTFDPTAMTLTVVNAGDTPPVIINPPTGDGLVITGDYNLCYNGNLEKVYYWGGASKPAWNGETMTTVTGSDGRSYKVFKVPEGTTNVIFSTKGDADKTGDLDYSGEYVMSNSGPTTTKVTFQNGDNPPVPTKPVVTANPASGTVFTTDAINVTLTVSPEATIHYSLNGTANASSAVYSGPITISETATLSTYAVTAEGASNTQTFSYTKRSGDDPFPPTPSGNSLNTRYYQTNPNGKVGTNKTINMNINNYVSTSALSNWTDAELIAQGVANDVCQMFKGGHEYPFYDTYALYAAYDAQYLYLACQYVNVFNGDSEHCKPYEAPIEICVALDLDPNKSLDGSKENGGQPWNDQDHTMKFSNGTDAFVKFHPKPGGTPAVFMPKPDGKFSYDASYCIGLENNSIGHQDGLLPSIQHIYGQTGYGYDPELLKGEEGFEDLKSKHPDSYHTIYEIKVPLTSLGITESYIKNTGIGVMWISTHGASATGSLPYDPTVYDCVLEEGKWGDNTSKEKDDVDTFTYNLARIGKMGQTSVVELPSVDVVDMEVEPVYYTLQGVQVKNPSNGLYIVVRGNKVTKEFIK